MALGTPLRVVRRNNDKEGAFNSRLYFDGLFHVVREYIDAKRVGRWHGLSPDDSSSSSSSSSSVVSAAVMLQVLRNHPRSHSTTLTLRA
jgi:hypothetical protein